MPSWSADRNPVEQLAEEFAQRLRRGETPSLSEYVRRYPEHANEIREVFPALVMMEQLKPGSGDRSGAALGQGVGAACGLGRLGDYLIVRELGRGGMGVVYEAEQVSLGRHVALKVLPPAALLNPTFRERFRREARAAASLHHTNIVPVFGVGESDGVPFYAMQFIRGEGLDKVLADLRRFGAGDAAAPSDGSTAHGLLSGRFAAPQPVGVAAGPVEAGPPSALSGSPTSSEYHRSVARVGVQVAEALAHAHAQGVLHRDVKPSNLLLDRQGRVWITDFGLAKAEGADELTHTGDIVGTLRFMAPERFDGHSLPQSDVYGLGLTLYELLTLRPAFDDTNKARLVEKVLHQPPVPLRKIDARVPRDLETVVLKCIAKDPAERYASAEALAEDLRRFLADRPIRARRSSAAERLGRWCRRNRWVAGLGTAVHLLLTVTAVGGVVMSLRLDASLRQGREAEREGKRKLFESYVSDADATRLSHRPGQRFGTLQRVRAALEVSREIGLNDEDKVRLRNIVVAALCLPDVETGPELQAGPDEPPPEGLDPVFRRRLLADRALSRLPTPAFVLRGDSWYSPDGRFVAVATEEYVKRVCVPARVWRIDGPKPVRVPDDEGPFEEATTFRPDGRQVAFGHADGTVRVYDTETGHAIRDLPPGSGAANCLAYHPTLPRLAVASNNEVAIWDVETGRRLVLLRHPTTACALAWHPRGHRLAVASYGRQIHLWDAESGRPITAPWRRCQARGHSPRVQPRRRPGRQHRMVLGPSAVGPGHRPTATQRAGPLARELRLRRPGARLRGETA